MRNKEIKKIKEEIRKANEEPFRERTPKLREIAVKIGAIVPNSPTEIVEVNRDIHSVLQTELMYNACVCAKWSCFWAAVAATVALLSAVAAWITVIVR